MINILLIRHGETDENRNGIVQGHLPTGLNRLGRQQARLVANRLAEFTPRIDRLISSDLPRAAQTADAIAKALSLSFSQDAAWRERSFGTFEGKSPAEREIMRQQLGLQAHDLPPGAQTVDAYQEGIRTAFLRLPEQYPDANCIAVVTHGGACRAIAMMLSDGRLAAAEGNLVPTDFTCPNCAVTHLVLEEAPAGPQFRYGCLYDVTHLQAIGALAADAG